MIAIIVFAPKLGAGNFIAVFVTCQVACAAALDLIGAVGYSRRAFSWQRWVGVALMAAGVALVTLFPGQPVEDKGPGGPVGRALTHLFRGSDATAAARRAAAAAPGSPKVGAMSIGV